MDELPKHSFNDPPEQQAIRNNCPHPHGAFVEFSMEDVESSIPSERRKNRVSITGLHCDQRLGEATNELTAETADP